MEVLQPLNVNAEERLTRYWFLYTQHSLASGSPRAVPRPPAAVSSGNLLEKRIL